MYEHLTTLFGGPPNIRHFRLYSEWAKHDWGIVLTGNVQVVPDHLTLGRDVVLPRDLSNPRDEDLHPFRRLADIIHSVGGNARDKPSKPDGSTTLALMQLSHAGRQSVNVIGGRRIFQRPMAPSPIRMGSSPARKTNLVEELMNNILFQQPKEMTEEDILHVIDRFVYGSVFAHKAGFDGIQLQVAHGCKFTFCCLNNA
jgi:2,4-dienoyl-CoA reductase-like NADH-dependent reductase (Old Yellow Enzyme family)